MSKVKGEQLDLTEAAITRQARQDAPPVRDEAPVATALTLVERMAMSKDCDCDKLAAICDFTERMSGIENQRELMADQREWSAAMARVQAQAPAAVKDAVNKQTKSNYAKTEDLVALLKPLWTAEGLWVTWDQDDGAKEGMTRYVAEIGYGLYSKRYVRDLPPDDAGIAGTKNKTLVHALKSSGTYAQGILLAHIFAITYKDHDNDGNGGEPVAMISARDSDDIAACLRDMPKGKVDEFWLSLDKGSLAEMTAAEAAKVLPWCRKCVREAKANG